jgi:two-component system response regulator FixJ
LPIVANGGLETMLDIEIGPSGGGGPTKRAYVVDDDEGFRRSMVMLLGANGWKAEGFESPQDFIDRAAALEPGLLLLDLNMPGRSGLDLLEAQLPELDRFAVVMVTGAGQIQTAVRTIKAGAIDFIEKPFAPVEILIRLESLNSTLRETIGAKAVVLEARRKIESLSPRERDVLERMLGGASNKHIARSLGLSPRTVEMHRAKMLGRLGVGTTLEALDVARHAGLKPVELE